jgi:hypothetical protein
MDKIHSTTNEKTYRPPVRMFEKTGTVYPEKAYHVFLEGVTNTDNQDIKTMIDNARYFSMFAPRQSGKTTFLESIRTQLHRDKTYVIILLNFQRYKDLNKKRFYGLVEKELYLQLINRLNEVECDKSKIVKKFLDKHRLIDQISLGELFEELNRILQYKKIVILIDEFDGIAIKELENFLNLLRYLYQQYKPVTQKALYSVGLIGIRNITKLVVGGVSPFNIADHVEFPPFTLQNVNDLYSQYTEETNQPFTEGAVKKVHEATAGQPWLVNRLGTILTVNVKPKTIEPIDETDVDEAIEILLNEKNLHFDNLSEKVGMYKETFIEIVFDNVAYNPENKDQSWLEQFGLIKKQGKKAVVANNIYKARYVNAFFDEVNANEEIRLQRYELPGNRLDMQSIILDFDEYISKIGVQAFYKEKKPYEKTGQFLLTAFLYQFVKGGGGELRYEIRSGLGVMDIILWYKGAGYIIETKLNNRKGIKGLIKRGIDQLAEKYLATESCEEGYLVVFDTQTPAGEECKPKDYRSGDKTVTCFIIGIGRTDG